METKQMVSLVEGQLEAYNNRDVEKFCTYFHPEVQAFRLNPVFEHRIKSLEEFSNGYAKMFAESPELYCQIKSRILLNESVIDEEWITGSANFPNGLHACAVYAFRDGLIDRVWFAR